MEICKQIQRWGLQLKGGSLSDDKELEKRLKKGAPATGTVGKFAGGLAVSHDSDTSRIQAGEGHNGKQNLHRAASRDVL